MMTSRLPFFAMTSEHVEVTGRCRTSVQPKVGRICLALAIGFFCPCFPAYAQLPEGSAGLRFGMDIAPDVDRITTRALSYLAKSQLPAGNWDNGFDTHASGRENSGVTGLALMAMLSTGVDPNSGPYAANIRSAIRYLITEQNPKTGFLPNTMYNHGFGMLALAEAYGVVDEALLWTDAKPEDDASKRRDLGEALRLAVECALKSQGQNPQKAWRYGPTSKDADTSVTGAVLVGLLAARNAGVPVPDQNINDAMEYIKTLTSRRTGDTGYTMGLGGLTGGSNLSAISTLVMSIGQQSDLEQHEAASKRIAKFVDQVDSSFPYYNMYYMAQALFQSDYESWKRWNEITIRRLRRQQKDDGSFDSEHGKAYATSMACLALALNYRFLPIYER